MTHSKTKVNPNNYTKYKTKLEFLPCNLTHISSDDNAPKNNDDNTSEDLPKQSYDIVMSFLKSNPIYIPLFLYAIYSFLTPLSELSCDDLFNIREYSLEDDTFPDTETGRLQYWGSNNEREPHFTNFHLWLHSKDSKTLNIAANLFLNVFSYGYTAIKNPYNFHINISKKIRINYSSHKRKGRDIDSLNTRPELIKELNKMYENISNDTKYPILENYTNIKNIPIIVYSNKGQLPSRSKIVKSIFEPNSKLKDLDDDRYRNITRVLDFKKTNLVFLSSHRMKQSECEALHCLDIDLSNAKKISEKEFKKLKPHVNIIYRHILGNLKDWYDGGKLVSEFSLDDTKYFIQNKDRLSYFTHHDKTIRSSTFREFFCHNLLLSGNILNYSLNINSSSPFNKTLHLICSGNYNALLPKPDTHLESDQELFLNHLKTILNEHINDSPQETVWMDKHKVALGKMEDVYSFNDQIIKEFLDKDIHNTSIALKKYLVSKDIMLKNDKRFVFNKNANSKKYYVYKIRAKYLT